MKIQEGIEQGIDLIRSVNTDEIIQKFDKFQMILDGFRKEFPSLIGSENQIKAAEKIREKECYIASKLIFSGIYIREYNKAKNIDDRFLSDEKINKIGNYLKARIKSFTHATHWINAEEDSWA